MKMKLMSAVGLFAASLLAMGCGSDNKTATAQGRLVVIHASPDAPAVDLIVDGVKAGSGLTFPNNTGYIGVAAGSRSISVNLAGTQTAVLTATDNVEANKNYSIFAAGRATATPSTLSLVVLDDNLAAPAAGKAHVRFVHLSPDAPAVDVAVTGGAVLFPNKAYKDATDFTPVDAGSYNLEVRLAGTTTVALALPNIPLAAGKIYTIFAKGLVSGTGAQALGAEKITHN